MTDQGGRRFYGVDMGSADRQHLRDRERLRDPRRPRLGLKFPKRERDEGLGG